MAWVLGSGGTAPDVANTSVCQPQCQHTVKQSGEADYWWYWTEEIATC